jgi:hypothetical protein
MALTYDYITTTTMGANATTLTISSIPSSYTDLIVTFTFRAVTGDARFVYLRMNGLTTGYSSLNFITEGGSAYGAIYAAQTEWRIGLSQNVQATSGWCVGQLEFQNYSDGNASANARQAMWTVGGVGNTTNNNSIYTGVGLCQTTNALNSITLFLAGGNELQAGTTMTIWGVLRA